MDRMVASFSSKKYLVSIIIPVYNRKRQLVKAIESVLNQTYKDTEIVIVDDGSADGLEKYITRYLQVKNTLIYIKQNNRGTPIALNTGIRISSGGLITFLDSDDLYLPEHIEKRVIIFKKNKNIDLIHTTAKIIGSRKNMFVPDANDTKKLIHLNQCVIGATLFGKREVFYKLNGFRNIYAYDYDFMKRASKNFNVQKYDIPTYIYNRNSKDSVLTKYKKKFELSEKNIV